MKCTPKRYTPIEAYTHKVHAYEVHIHEIHAL
jgi:hypothetical protein